MSEVSSVSQEEWQLWRDFFRMRRQLDLALERELQRDADISAPDYEILLALFEASDKQLRARELGGQLGWEKSRLSHQVTRMEKRGLVVRSECDTDGRGTWISITAEGSRVILGAMRDHATRIRRYFFDALTEDDKAALGRASEAILAAIDPPPCDEKACDDSVADDTVADGVAVEAEAPASEVRATGVLTSEAVASEVVASEALKTEVLASGVAP